MTRSRDFPPTLRRKKDFFHSAARVLLQISQAWCAFNSKYEINTERIKTRERSSISSPNELFKFINFGQKYRNIFIFHSFYTEVVCLELKAPLFAWFYSSVRTEHLFFYSIFVRGIYVFLRFLLYFISNHFTPLVFLERNQLY